VNGFLAWPAELRMAAAALLGLIFGAAANWAAYSLAYEPRYLSPWSPRHPGSRRLLDFVPIVGWWSLRRKHAEFDAAFRAVYGKDALPVGPRFWVRPLAVEIIMPVAAALWYWWEAIQGGLLLPRPLPAQIAANPDLEYVLHFEFTAHLVLAALMLAASLIDWDEKFIPDGITVVGALVGLTFVTAFPWSLLPAPVPGGPAGPAEFFLHAAAPNAWPPLFEAGELSALAVGLACFWIWCFGLMNRVWYARYGYRVALALFWRRIRRDEASPKLLLLALFGGILIGIVWMHDPFRWKHLLTSLLGLAVAGGVVWVIRVVGTYGLGVEAMGFGDVTLMAMIGSFVGWQPSIFIFFAAPIAALALNGLQYVLGKREEIPYGPYLCLAAVAVVAGWGPIWQWAEPRFEIGWLIPVAILLGFVMLLPILMLLRRFRER
jgi:prepilin signal peptidase PulO-like enzyme (type II secretory pathway)